LKRRVSSRVIPCSEKPRAEKKFKLYDEFLRFYFKFVHPYKKLITDSKRSNIFKAEVLPKWNAWLGFAFEGFCLKHHDIIARALEIDDKILDYGPLFERGQDKFQIDLLFRTNEKEIFLCECKYTTEPVSGDVIAETQKKMEYFHVPSGHRLRKVLISPSGASKAVQDSRYFDHIIILEDLFR